LNHANDSTYTVQQYNSSSNYSESSLLSKINHLKKELVTNHSSTDLEKVITVYKEIGNAFQLLNQFDSAVYYYEKGADLAKEEKLEKLYSSIAYNLGLAYSVTGKYDLAIQYALKGLAIDKKLNNKEDIATAQNGIAIIYQRQGIYDKALEHLLQSIKLSEKSGNQREVANSYYNLGTIYFKLEKTNQSLKYFNLSKTNYTELINKDSSNLSLKQGLSETLYSIAGIFLTQGLLSDALRTYDSALTIKSQTLDKIGMANIYNQIGTIYFLQEEYPLSIVNFTKSLQNKRNIDDYKGVAIAYFNIARVYFVQNRIERSEKFLDLSIKTAKQIHDKEVLKESYLMLSKVYELKKKPFEALKYHKLYTSYSDSVMNENTAKVIEELSVQYETERKEQENKILQKDNRIKTLKIKRQKLFAFFLSGTAVLVLLIAVVLFRLYNSKKKSNKIISSKNMLLEERNTQIVSQNKTIESKNRDLTDSINYAKRIQESMLTNEAELNNTLTDAFILMKPKDIVSGDFYWFGQQNNQFVISAIDCTGHGVPGAFMSLLGNSFLENIIYDEKVIAPEKILDKLNHSIQKALKQAETNNQDGMDMALCSINQKNKTVEFSGAKNPLVYIQNNEVHIVKGDKFPIGRSLYNAVKFSKHKIKVDTPTCFYMFSDGYADQFGGPDNSKFKSPRLRNLLLEIHSKPMREQKDILNKTIEEWKGKQEQIDDILIVGFKIS
jgi:serine phosphatase RsbU (regulator of sigma subunit)/Tfp pilus assembly protein PilF